MAKKSFKNKIEKHAKIGLKNNGDSEANDGLSLPAPSLSFGGAIQAKLDDGHDLTSVDFKGDKDLEACFDGEKIICFGSSGSSVLKIQKKLLTLGYQLPKYGADGVFGSETKTTIVAFQTANGLAPDGVIGKSTIGQLDSAKSSKPEPLKPEPKPDPEPPKPEPKPGPEPPKPEPKPGPEPPKPEPKPDNSLTVEKAKEQIQNAASGWGTDENSIYDAIRRCNSRSGLSSDPHLMELIRDELSGGDLWKALFLLQYGDEANFPKSINKILDAASGWGTNENAIYKTLEELTDPEKEQFKNMPYLWELLEDELNSEELQKAFSKVVGGYDYSAALQKHQKNIDDTKKVLEEMKVGSTKEKNTADWLDSSRTGRAKNILHIMTKTHDGTARANHFGHKDNKDAYVGNEDEFPNNTGYEESIDSKRNINFIQRRTGGLHSGKHIWLFEPINNSSKMLLVHEVQHDADRHDDEPGHDKPAGSPEESINRYKSEFRAYWQDGRYDSTSDTDKPSPDDGWQNKRQKEIFDGMISSGLYQHVADNFKKNEKVNGIPYKDIVKGYGSPEGVNLENSPRIDDFYLQLKKCNKKHSKFDENPLQKLKTLTENLNETDKIYINSIMAKSLQNLMKSNLDINPLDVITKIIGDGTKPTWV